jgi:hypothetical protein
MHRSLNYALRGLFALSLLAPAAMLTTAPVAAARVAAAPVAAAQVVTATIAATTTCSNGVDDTPGLGLICQITIVNTITGTGGSATVTVKECHGASGAPTAACTTTTTSLTQPVTSVNQCNDSINGGGGSLRCSVTVTQNFYSLNPGPIASTVNQCVGSGGGITTGCNPFPANTTSAAITQCNGSANGGTLVGLTCTATGSSASAGAVTINQCNGSANGGGALVICSASTTSNAFRGTLPPTSTVSSGSTSNNSTPPPFGLLISFALAGIGLALVLNRRRSALS